jgi:hypothetical protein
MAAVATLPDELLAFLVRASPSAESEIAKEHIQSTRSALLGAMPAECEFDLKLARNAIGRLGDVSTRRNAQKILSSLAPTEHPEGQPDVMRTRPGG